MGAIRIPPAAERTLTVPLSPGPGARCSVRFRVAETRVPARVEPGSTDPRHLGARFLRFDYHGA